MKKEKKKSGNARKIGRDINKCARYRARAIREINKRRRLNRHLLFNPKDGCAKGALAKLAETLIG